VRRGLETSAQWPVPGYDGLINARFVGWQDRRELRFAARNGSCGLMGQPCDFDCPARTEAWKCRRSLRACPGSWPTGPLSW